MTFNKFFIIYHLAALNGATIENLDDRIVISGIELEDIVVSEDDKTSYFIYHLAALNGATIENLDDRIVINGIELEDIVVSEDDKTSYFKFRGGEIITVRVYYQNENTAVIIFDNRSMITCDNKLGVMTKHREFLETDRLDVLKSQDSYNLIRP